MTEIKKKAGQSAPGLTPEEAELSRKIHGENLLPKAKRKSFWGKFITNMKDPVIKILIAALLINLIFNFGHSDPIESLGIGVSILLATFISTLSEQGSEKAFDRLESLSRNELCRVRRCEKGNCRILSIPIYDVVVGDRILLSAGDRIPADGVLVVGALGVDQSGLNGESKEAKKTSGIDFLSDPSNEHSVFGGCTVLSGEGEMEVVRVGGESLLGGISREIQSETRESPLKARLTKLAKQISVIGYVAAALCAAAYALSNLVFFPTEELTRWVVINELLHALTLGLTVIVMAVPEGLPTMIAVVLSSNMKRMVKDSVLVRKPVGIEAAGSMNILFTDKTGTITEGQMKVGGIVLANGEKFSPSGLAKNHPRHSEIYRLFADFGECQITPDGLVGGNSTERAIVESASCIKPSEGFSLSERLPFDSNRKFTAVRLIGKSNLTLVKGAPEAILPYVATCLTPEGNEKPISSAELSKIVLSPAKSGWRVIAMCLSHSPIHSGKAPSSLCFVCSVLIADRPRVTAPCSIETLRRAGIQVVMITGDNRETAVSVAERCGIIRFGDDLCLTRDQLSKMTDEEVVAALPRLRVVARALPSDKSRLVRLAQDMGLVVGMTGDGVNDAPALKAADVGFAMGSGTGVAKEAGDVVILDNDLSSISKAVLYGRTIFKSIRKFIVLQLTINLCAVGVTMLGPFVGIESPVTVTQMLWINIVMDTLGGIAFAGEPALDYYMKERPKARNEAILNGYMIGQIVSLGAFTTALLMTFLKNPVITQRFGGEGSAEHLTAFFTFFIFTGVFNCFIARSDRTDILGGLSKNKSFLIIMPAVATVQIAFIYLGGSVLRTVPIPPRDLLFTLLSALPVFPFEFFNRILRRLGGKKGGY